MHTLASYIGCIVNPACLQQCLLLLPGQTDASVYTLLNPDDPQDVPHVILLLEAVVALRVRRVEFNVSLLDINTNSDLDTITVTIMHFPIRSGSFPAVYGHSSCSLLYGCCVLSNFPVASG
jgi:hypothetical protein